MGRQAEASKHVRRDRSVAKDAAAAGADVRSGDEQLDRRARHPVEIDRLGEDVAQRIGPARVQLVGREQARHEIHRDEGGRIIERPAAHEHIEGCALERAEPGSLGHLAPECLQGSAGIPGPALGETVGEHHGVHGARRRSRDAVDAEPRLLQQPIEDAPGEGAVRASALERQINEDRALGSLRPIEGLVTRASGGTRWPRPHRRCGYNGSRSVRRTCRPGCSNDPQCSAEAWSAGRSKRADSGHRPSP